MATSRVQPLFVLLLASLFFSPTLGGIPFVPCVSTEGDVESTTHLGASSAVVTDGDMISEIETSKGSYRGPPPVINFLSVDPVFLDEGWFKYFYTGFTVTINSTQGLIGQPADVDISMSLYHHTERVYYFRDRICARTNCGTSPGVHVVSYRNIMKWDIRNNLHARILIYPGFGPSVCITSVFCRGSSSLKSLNENMNSIL